GLLGAYRGACVDRVDARADVDVREPQREHLRPRASGRIERLVLARAGHRRVDVRVTHENHGRRRLLLEEPRKTDDGGRVADERDHARARAAATFPDIPIVLTHYRCCESSCSRLGSRTTTYSA